MFLLQVKTFIYIVAVFYLALMSLSALAAGDVEIKSRPGKVIFSHSRHQPIACDKCHHEKSETIYSCRRCHFKSATQVLNSEQAFHRLCIDCHLEEKKAAQDAGPVKLCSRCHKK